MDEGYSPRQVNSLVEFVQALDFPEWHDDAACEDLPREWFFGIEELPGRRRHRPTLTGPEIQRAKQVCEECPVLQECFDWAMTMRESHGIWGATTPRERQDIWRKAEEGSSSLRR